jgi:hypothetical protein
MNCSIGCSIVSPLRWRRPSKPGTAHPIKIFDGCFFRNKKNFSVNCHRDGLTVKLMSIGLFSTLILSPTTGDKRPLFKDLLRYLPCTTRLVATQSRREANPSRRLRPRQQPEPARQPLRRTPVEHRLDRADRGQQVTLRIGLGEAAERDFLATELLGTDLEPVPSPSRMGRGPVQNAFLSNPRALEPDTLDGCRIGDQIRRRHQ